MMPKLCECGCEKEVIQKYSHYIPRFLSGHNLKNLPPHNQGKSSWNKGISMSQEQKDKISKTLKGRSNLALKGKSLSEDHKKNISRTLTGYKHSEEFCRKNSESHMGHITSAVTRRKISETQKGRPVPEERRKKISESLRERTAWNKEMGFSEDIKKKNSETQKKAWVEGKFDNRAINLNNNGSYGIPTEYNGIIFRSKIESRVAKLLDMANIKYKYEPETIKISELNTTYTPDFYLPEFNIYIETKYDYKFDSNIYKIEYLRKYKNYRITVVRGKEIIHLENNLSYV